MHTIRFWGQSAYKVHAPDTWRPGSFLSLQNYLFFFMENDCGRFRERPVCQDFSYENHRVLHALVVDEREPPTAINGFTGGILIFIV
jgi:hypothetical protein